jgi:predicted Fe-Mo cluster-binding NifX family protein
MSAIALMTLLNREDSTLSLHFGKAKWLMVVETGTGKSKFVQNAGLNGRSVVDLLVSNRCTDVVFNEIGPGALRHLQSANICGWFGPADMPAPQLLELFRAGKLGRAIEPREGHQGHGCGQRTAGQHSGEMSGRQGCCCAATK